VAKANEVTVSSSVVDNIKNIEGLNITFESEQTFKNIDQPIKIHQVRVEKEFPTSEPKPSLSSLKSAISKDFAFPNITPPQKRTLPEIDISSNAFGVFGHAWGQMKKYFLPLFLIVVLLAFAMGPFSIIEDEGSAESLDIVFQSLGFFWWLLVLAPLSYGAAYFLLNAAQDIEPNLKDIKVGFYYYLNVIFARILVTGIIGIGFFLLVIPGIIFACRLSFVQYLVVDEGLDAVQAVQTSWKMTRGYTWTIIGMGFLSFWIFIGGMIVLLVGAVVSIMWIETAFASLYYAVKKKEELAQESQTELETAQA